MRSRLVPLVASAVVLLLLAAGSLALWRWTPRGPAFADAVELAPAGTERIGTRRAGERSATGQGGDFAERFAVVSATAEASTLVLELRPREGAYVVSDLSAGPVLFASC